MTQAQQDAIKADYLEWTGGFEPETPEDIETYLTTSIPIAVDEAEARDLLIGWMHESAAHPHAD